MKNTIAIITSFPEKRKHSHAHGNFNAIGWHAEKIISRLSRDTQIVVFAEKTTKKNTTSILNSHVKINRIWEKGNPLSIFFLWKHIYNLKNVERVYIPFEFNIFGGTLPNIALVALLFILKLLGKQITLEFHQVIFDVGELKKHIYIKNELQKLAYNMGLKVFYTLIGLLAQSLIVFEVELKERLSTFVDSDKIHVLSLSTSRSTTLSKNQARDKIKIAKKDFILLVFGYINGYKGIPWIIEKLQSSARIIIAGGRNPYLKHLPHYKKFYSSVVNTAKKLPHVTHTGFIADSKIEAYFKAADIVVIPYEVFMSASGPFSLALSYKRPVLLADTLEDYCKSEDFMSAMQQAGLKKKDIFFSHKNNELQLLIDKYRVDTRYQVKLNKFVKILGEQRSEEKVIAKLSSLLLFTVPLKKATINISPRLVLE